MIGLLHVDGDVVELAGGVVVQVLPGAGLVAARRLHAEHDLTVYEAAEWIGGHTHTLDVPRGDGSTVAVDTGFIVFNRATYPRFCALLSELGLGAQPSDMSFSVSSERSGVEWASHGPSAFFARRTSLFRPSQWWLLREKLRVVQDGDILNIKFSV